MKMSGSNGGKACRAGHAEKKMNPGVELAEALKTEVLTKYLTEEAKKDPVAMGQLVRTWLNETET
jgi:flagellar biosynthesis/type III secretory pathway M-ring protein FliF/YscJ